MGSLETQRTEMTEAVAAALDEAARRGHRNARPVGTWDLLVVLKAVGSDIVGWGHIEREFGEPAAGELAPTAEPVSERDTWLGTPFTCTCAAAVRAAALMAANYDLVPVSPGVLALCLFADPASTASTRLTGGDPRRWADLLAMVQDELIGSDLEGIEMVLPLCLGAAREAATASVTVPGEPNSSATDAATTPLSFAQLVLAGMDDPPPAAAQTDGLSFLAELMRKSQDDALNRRLRRLMADADSLHVVRPFVTGFEADTAADVIARARERFDTDDPDAAQPIVAATVTPAPATDRALWYLGFSGREKAFEAADVDEERRLGRPNASGISLLLLLVGTLLAAANSAVVVREAATTHAWWKLGLLVPVWLGHPTASPLVSVGGSGLLWALIGPLSGVLALAGVACDVGRSWAQRRLAFQRTGIDLSTPEWRGHCVRLRGRGLLASVLRMNSPRRLLEQHRRVRRRLQRIGV